MRIRGRESSFGKAFLSNKWFVDKNELVEKRKEIYKKIKDKLEPEHKGEVVAIEIKSGDYFVGKSVIEADRNARKRHPDEVFYFGKVSYRTLHIHR